MRRKLFTTITLLSGSILLLSSLTGWMKKPDRVDPAAIRQSVTKSLGLLQPSSYVFTNNAKFKCASCHHNSLTAIAAGLAAEKGIDLIDTLTTARINTLASMISNNCNPNLNDQLVAVNFIPPYMLLGLYAEKYPPNLYTDIAVEYIISQWLPDGSYITESGRPPLETGKIHLAAMDSRSLLLYAAPGRRKKVNELIARSKQWIEQQHPDDHQELVFQLLGMQWCGSTGEVKQIVTRKLTLLQREDGGWAQLSTMKSDAYATGQTLYALYESGTVKPSDDVYQRGLTYLLKTQNAEGAWIVATRAYAIQPPMNSQFPPYDENQFISAAASNWATIALLSALPDKGK